jgi:hypothetical protein
VAIIETTLSSTTGPAVIFALKEAWKGQGATVLSSGDGTTYNASGDQISHAGSGAGGLANADAWFLIEEPGGGRQLVFQRQDNENWRVILSPSAGFTGGSPNATTPPTASDGVGQLSPALLFLSDGSMDAKVHVQDFAPWGWGFVTFLAGDTFPVTYVVHWPMLAGPEARSTTLTFNFGDPNLSYAITSGTPDAYQVTSSTLLLDAGTAADTTAPVISTTAGSSIARTDSVSVDVTDDSGDPGTVEIWAVLADGTALTVYDGADFLGVFAASSTRTPITDGYTYEAAPAAPGWPSVTVELHVRAIDAAGNGAEAFETYTVSDPPAAPVIGGFSPSDGGSITRTGTVVIDVTDDEGRTAITLVTIFATLADGTVVGVYDGAAFGALFSASRTNITDGYRYTFAHASPGWASSTLAFRIVAVDAQGRTTTHTTYNLTISNPPSAPDTTAPTVTLVSPADGSTITRTPIVVDVTDASTFAALFVWVTYNDGRAPDLVHDGESFQVPFAGNSTRVSISGGYRYTLRRAGGWPAAPTVHVLPVDTAGNTP